MHFFDVLDTFEQKSENRQKSKKWPKWAILAIFCPKYAYFWNLEFVSQKRKLIYFRQFNNQRASHNVISLFYVLNVFFGKFKVDFFGPQKSKKLPFLPILAKLEVGKKSLF